MKKFLAFIVLSSLLTFAVVALAKATVLVDAAPSPGLPSSRVLPGHLV
jgi:hypothetical protein